MFNFLTFIVLITACAAAGGDLFDEKGKRVALYENRKLGLYLSAGCAKPDGKLNCRAHDALAAASFRAVQGKLAGGANPGAAICDSIAGEVTILKDEKGNENSFCRFGDESLVATGTLMRYGQQNDDKRRKAR